MKICPFQYQHLTGHLPICPVPTFLCLSPAVEAAAAPLSPHTSLQHLCITLDWHISLLQNFTLSLMPVKQASLVYFVKFCKLFPSVLHERIDLICKHRQWRIGTFVNILVSIILQEINVPGIWQIPLSYVVKYWNVSILLPKHLKLSYHFW